MTRQRTLMAALLAAVLVIGAGTAKAQETGVAQAQDTARIAVPAGIAINAETHFIVRTNVVGDSRIFVGLRDGREIQLKLPMQ